MKIQAFFFKFSFEVFLHEFSLEKLDFPSINLDFQYIDIRSAIHITGNLIIELLTFILNDCGLTVLLNASKSSFDKSTAVGAFLGLLLHSCNIQDMAKNLCL